MPCADATAADFTLTQAQIDYLGDTLADQVVAVDEEHFGPMGAADPTEPATDSLVMLVYNVQDANYYDCAETTYTAGYFAPDYADSIGMNVIVIDAFDWANRVGPDDAEWRDDDPSNDQATLYEGVVAHELEHLLHNYSDPGELSWVDEGLADFAVFLNGFDVGGSHLTYHQVFYADTSLTRWGGGLQNYGAAYTFFQYLWEQAGGNGDGTYTPDLRVRRRRWRPPHQADLRRAGRRHDRCAERHRRLQRRDRGPTCAAPRSCSRTGRSPSTWTTRRRRASTSRPSTSVTRRSRRGRSTSPTSCSGAAGAATEAPSPRPSGSGGPTARSRRPSRSVCTSSASATRDPTSRWPSPVSPSARWRRTAPPTHWYAGYESQSDNILDVDVTGTVTSLDFWTWYFIEEGWDFGFVEALVNGEWVTVPLVDDSGTVVTTDDDPHGNNTEGNGITGTSGGEYFVDEPVYVHLTAQLPAGATDVRFRYSTDAAYLDTGWFVDDVSVNGAPATLSSPPGDWFETTGVQDNNWTVQVVASCDLTPGVTSPFEIVDGAGNFVYRLEGDQITQALQHQVRQRPEPRLRRAHLEPPHR